MNSELSSKTVLEEDDVTINNCIDVDDIGNSQKTKFLKNVS